MNRDSDVDDSELINKCPKSIFYMLINNVMLAGVRECSVRTVDGVHKKKTMGCVVNVCTHKQFMGGTSESFVHSERLESSVETAVG